LIQVRAFEEEQVRQLAGHARFDGQAAKSMSGATGELIENPIIANFREGLSILEVLYLYTRCHVKVLLIPH